MNLITSALPYANGLLHLGHIAGAYLPADVFVRFLKMQEKPCLFICGTDAHGVPILLRSREEKKSPEDVLKFYHEKIKEDFFKLAIDFDFFGTTHSKNHFKFSQIFFQKLYKNGFLKKKKQNQFFCAKDRIFLPDRYIKGECFSCHYKEARGDECPKCGDWMDPLKIIEARCQICNSIPILKETEHWFFIFSDLLKLLEEWVDSDLFEDFRGVKNYIKAKINEGIPDRSISRDIPWGIPIPDSLEDELQENSYDFENLSDKNKKCLYVWFEAVIGYLSITYTYLEKTYSKEEALALFENIWKNKTTKIYHFIGKDNLIFHTIFLPCILTGLKESYQLPYKVVSNSHLNIDGEKISSSNKEKSVIWLRDLLEKVPADYIRYYILCILPEKKDSSFSWKEFQEKINQDLNNRLGNLIHRTIHFISKNFQKNLSKGLLNLSEDEENLIEKFHSEILQIQKNLENTELKKAIHKVFSLVDLGNQFFDMKKPWVLIKSDIKETEKVLKLSLFFIKKISILLAPFIPESSKKIWNLLHSDHPIEHYSDLKWSILEEKDLSIGYKIKSPEILFKKIEDHKIKEWQTSISS